MVAAGVVMLFAPPRAALPDSIRNVPLATVDPTELRWRVAIDAQGGFLGLPPTADAPPAAAPRGDVVLYMATWCGYCKAAKSYLAGKGIAYRELDIDTPSGKAAFKQLGARGVPVLLTNGQKIAGFTPQAYDAVFMPRK